MPLQGTFDVLGFADVLQLLGRRHLTGRLHVRSRTMGANLYLDEGLLIGADLGDHSTNTTSDVRGRLEEICFELLETERGTFEFVPDLVGMGAVTVSVKVETVLARARRRLEDWRQIQTVIPSLDLHPRIVSHLETDQVTLNRERWRLITAIDGRRSLRALARNLGLGEYETCRMVKSLMDDGVIELDGPHVGLPTPPGATIAPGARPRIAFVDDDTKENQRKGSDRQAEPVAESGPPSASGPASASGPTSALGPTSASEASEPAAEVASDDEEAPAQRPRSGIVRIGRRLRTSGEETDDGSPGPPDH
jgi:Domain of unknown function (DUF4388)